MTQAWTATWGPPISACIFRGQVICAGRVYTSSIFPGPSLSDSRIIRWSDIGAFRFLGATAEPMKNEAGEMYMPISDDEMVMRVLPLKSGVVVYGTFNIFFLEPVSTPAPTFKIVPLLPVGISNPLAVAGNVMLGQEGATEHILIDRGGTLRRIYIGPYGNILDEDKGYTEFFKDMQEDTINVVYNTRESEYYIGNGVKTYLYNSVGLTEVNKIITSVVDLKDAALTVEWTDNYLDEPIGVVIDTQGYNYVYLESDIIDFNLASKKTIMGVAVNGSVEDAEVMVKWRNSKSGEFIDTVWKRCNPGGYAYPIVSGVDFIVCVRAMPVEGVNINSVGLEWKMTDKSSVRGLQSDAGGAAS